MNGLRLQYRITIFIVSKNGHPQKAINFDPVTDEQVANDICENVIDVLKLRGRPYRLVLGDTVTWIFPEDFAGIKYKAEVTTNGQESK